MHVLMLRIVVTDILTVMVIRTQPVILALIVLLTGTTAMIKMMIEIMMIIYIMLINCDNHNGDDDEFDGDKNSDD